MCKSACASWPRPGPPTPPCRRVHHPLEAGHACMHACDITTGWLGMFLSMPACLHRTCLCLLAWRQRLASHHIVSYHGVARASIPRVHMHAGLVLHPHPCSAAWALAARCDNCDVPANALCVADHASAAPHTHFILAGSSGVRHCCCCWASPGCARSSQLHVHCSASCTGQRAAVGHAQLD